MKTQVLQTLDEELQGIKDAYYSVTSCSGCEAVIPLKERLLIQYGDQIADSSSLGKMVATNKAYSMAKTPVVEGENENGEKVIRPNPIHRVVQDDIGWGLCVLV